MGKVHLTLLVFVNIILINLINAEKCETATKPRHVINVSQWPLRNDSRECLRNRSIACAHLDYVFENVKDFDSTVIYVEAGHYRLSKNFTFTNVNEMAIIGKRPTILPGQVVVECELNAGLSFLYASRIVISNVIFTSCGSIQNSTSISNHTRAHRTFLTALFLVNCIHVCMEYLTIKHSPGIAMQFYDVAGSVNISNSFFVNNGRQAIPLAKPVPGGGFYFEFTFRGGLYPFHAPPDEKYQSHGVYHFTDVFFESNTAPEVAETVQPGGYNHVAFGRGGGASFYIKGRARNNSFVFKNCHFNGNRAEWGAGLFLEFQDQTKTNSFTFRSCNFHSNHASIGGGGIRVGLIVMQLNESFIPNTINFYHCLFQKNTAISGGGISFYGTTKQSYLVFRTESFVNFTNCTIKENKARIAAALGAALWNTNHYGVGGNGPWKIAVKNSTIEHNQIDEIIYSNSEKMTGGGAGSGCFYSKDVPIILMHTHFKSNSKTALILDSAFVEIVGNVSFKANRGLRGGAISLYGNSKIIVDCWANLVFINNTCTIKGGAIYVRTAGPQIVPFHTTELKLHYCFFSSPCQFSNYSVSFYDNRAEEESSGHSVYATTLKACRHEDEKRVNNTALEWDTFHYHNADGTKSNRKYEIVTDALNMQFDKRDWNATPGKSFSPLVKLTDEKSNDVYGVINVAIIPKNKKDVVKLSPPSAYFLSKDRIQSIKLTAEPGIKYGIVLQTVDSDFISESIASAQTLACQPGFHWERSDCRCLDTIQGVSRCGYEKQSLFLLKGYWGGHQRLTGAFAVAPCPENYCRCSQSNLTSSSECLFSETKRCKGYREGQVCGKCKEGYALKIGMDECTPECNNENSFRWIGILVVILVILTLLVLLIMAINFDPFSAYLNAWLFFYQVVRHIIPPYVMTNLDAFMIFLTYLANFQVVGLGGLCLWSGLDDLQKLAFNYISPLYVVVCLFVLSKIVVRWPNNVFTRRFTQTSLARAFCTLFVFSYSTVVNVSFHILAPVEIDGDYFVFFQGDERYFGSYHVGFACVALVLVVFVGIFFPLCLTFRSRFGCIDRGLVTLLLDNFQRCYRPGFQWCAGFYFVCRFFITIISVWVKGGALKIGLFNGACCIILAVFVLCRPYARGDATMWIPYKILNITDAILLCNLCLISSFAGASASIDAHLYMEGFTVLISILCYVPLVFSLGLVVYALCVKCRRNDRLLQNVDE